MKLSDLLLICLLLLPATVLAGNFNYDYVEIDYLHISPRTGNISKGPELQLSYTVPALEAQLLAGYARLDTPATAADINNHNYWLGIRGENSFGSSTDFYTDILYLNNRATSPNTASTDNGYRLRLGMRHQFSPRLEFDGSLAHDYLRQSSNEAGLGMVFNATPYFALGVSYAHDTQYNNTATLRLRLYY